jgi:hypothetical protein
MLYTEKKHTTHCSISGCRARGHAESIDKSCGAVASNGMRCDSNPHPQWELHHCCGATWEMHW